MKIVLVNPNSNMPYGLLYIAAYLRKHGVKSEITHWRDLNRLGRLDIIGITDMFTANHKVVLWIAKAVKYASPGTKIVLGGNHASANAEELIKLPCIDHVVVGEGEQAMLDIVNGCTEKIVRRPYLNIDDIPMPAYDLIEMEQYIANKANPFSMRDRTLAIISSRGCPNDCAYCSIKTIWGRTWRGRNPKSVVDEIQYLQKKYNVHEFGFMDDSVSVDSKRLFEICREIIKRKLNIKWSTPNGIAHWTLSEELLDIMKQSGCYRITFGIESGSPRIRKYIGKGYSLEIATWLLNYANSIGIWTTTTNIIGLPYETLLDARKTVQYAIDCGTDFACFFPLTPHKNTKAGDDKDKIMPEDWDSFRSAAYRKFLMHRIFFSPFRVFSKIRSWEDILFSIKIIKMGFEILINNVWEKAHPIYGDRELF